MSTRQVADLLAAAAPEVVPSRDTLRAVAPDRYTLKVSIDQECEQGLRLLKDLTTRACRGATWWRAWCARRWRGTTRAPRPALGVSPNGGPSGASAAAAEHTTRDTVRSRRQAPPRRHIPAAVRRHVWQRDGGRCCYRDPLTGRRCTSSHLLQIDHLLRSPRGVARSRPTSS